MNHFICIDVAVPLKNCHTEPCFAHGHGRCFDYGDVHLCFTNIIFLPCFISVLTQTGIFLLCQFSETDLPMFLGMFFHQINIDVSFFFKWPVFLEIFYLCSFLGVLHTNICSSGFPWDDENWCFSRLVLFALWTLTSVTSPAKIFSG